MLEGLKMKFIRSLQTSKRDGFQRVCLPRCVSHNLPFSKATRCEIDYDEGSGVITIKPLLNGERLRE